MQDHAPHPAAPIDWPSREWDLIVIGGGITGAAVLREAVRAGLSALLLEQRDFAWGASSRTGKWVHGGLRYLKEGQIGVTWHSVREREKLCREFQGMVAMKPMHWPLFDGAWQDEWLIRAGLMAYDWMAGKRWRHMVSLPEMQRLFPQLQAPGLKGAICFYEGQADDARMTLRVIHEARKAGGVAVNYAPVVALEKVDGLVRGVHVNVPGGTAPVIVRAKQVMAATGAWSDQLRAHVRHDASQRLRPLRGSHLVLARERLPITHTIVLQHPRDRRPGFVAPFQGRVIVGNTDLDHRQDLQADAYATSEEVDYLLQNLQHHFPSLQLGRRDVIATFSGVRPVVDSGSKDPSKESRDHVVWHEDDLVTIGGGKLTTFQHIALDALRHVRGKFPQLSALHHGQPVLFDTPPPLAAPAGLTPEQTERLLGRYGAAAHAMLQQAPAESLGVIPGTETHWCELPWCAANEAVQHLDDLLLRRTRIGLLLEQGGQAWLPRIRELVQAPLGWSDERWSSEAARYLSLWQQHYSVMRTEPEAA